VAGLDRFGLYNTSGSVRSSFSKLRGRSSALAHACYIYEPNLEEVINL
jgi:hypothetical protein